MRLLKIRPLGLTDVAFRAIGHFPNGRIRMPLAPANQQFLYHHRGTRHFKTHVHPRSSRTARGLTGFHENPLSPH